MKIEHVCFLCGRFDKWKSKAKIKMFPLGNSPGTEPYWNCHGMDRAMSFGAYLHNFEALIGA